MTGIEFKQELHKPVLAIIDGDSIPYIVCNDKKDAETKKTLKDCIDACDDYLANILKDMGADYYVGYLTVGKCFRYDIYPDYKANRKYKDLSPYNLLVKNYLQTKGFTYIDGYEADDCVVSFKNKYKDKYDCIIATTDKDVLKLEGNHFNYKKMSFETTTPAEAIEHFWKSMVTGDSVDNIKGIPKKGEAFFKKVILDSDGILTKKVPESLVRTKILNEYINHFGEYNGIKEFTKNYLLLKMVEDIDLNDDNVTKVNHNLDSEQTEEERTDSW
jgi:5'-3' exonuclease